MSDYGEDEDTSKTNDENTRTLDEQKLARLNRHFAVLAHSHHRQILYYLNNHRTEAVTIDELARHLKALETMYSSDTLVKAEYTSVKQELFHNHLPRLADDGIIDFDAQGVFRQPGSDRRPADAYLTGSIPATLEATYRQCVGMNCILYCRRQHSLRSGLPPVFYYRER